MKRELYRSKKDKMLGGVCGGLAEYFDISSTLVRLICLGLIIADGIGLILYILAWIIIPEEGDFEDKSEAVEEKNNLDKTSDTSKKNTIIGLVFILFGLFFLLNNFFPNILSFSLMVGISFFVLGIYLMIKGGKQ
ncbi:PspC domain-containing protein [Marinitoga arctica]